MRPITKEQAEAALAEEGRKPRQRTPAEEVFVLVTEDGPKGVALAPEVRHAADPPRGVDTSIRGNIGSGWGEFRRR